MPLPSGFEWIVILVIALLILGPGKLPDVASAVGKSIREFRKASSEVQDSVRLETNPATPAQPPVTPEQVAAAPVVTPAVPPVVSAEVPTAQPVVSAATPASDTPEAAPVVQAEPQPLSPAAPHNDSTSQPNL